MANIAFVDVTTTTPEPYDSNNPDRQRENFFYVMNQLLVLAKSAGFIISDHIDFSGVEQAINDLQYEGTILDAGGFKIIKTRKNTGVLQT